MDLTDLCDRIKEVRSGSGLTQAEVARRAEISLTRYQAIEGGRVPEVGHRFLLRVMNVVGLDLRVTTLNANRPTLDDLVQEEEDDHAPRLG